MQTIYVYIHLNAEFVPAGIMSTHQEGNYGYSTFQYGHRYLERIDAVPIDPVALPLSTIEFQTPEYLILFGGIRDAAPDSWGRYLLDKESDKPLTEFDYLVRAGLDRVGALGFGPNPINGPVRFTAANTTTSSFSQENLNLDDLIFAAEKYMENGEEIDKRLQFFSEYGSSFGGARPKALANYNGRSWLAKFADKGDSRSETRIEYANMALAKKCGITVPEIEHATVVSNRNVFLIERFDRYWINQAKYRIHFVSGLTMLGEHESYVVQIDPERHSYGSLADIIRRYGAHDFIEKDLEELFRRMVYNAICSNSDDHLKNHGFLYDQQAKGWRLSPAYDIVPDKNPHGQLGLGVGPDGRNSSFDNIRKGAGRFGLNRDDAEYIIGEMCSITQNWQSFFETCRVPKTDIEKLQHNFSQSTRTLRGPGLA